jgi:hypothetical protein
MDQASNQTCLRAKLLNVLASQLGLENFDRRWRFQVDMLTQVDLCEASLSQQTNQAIVAQVLSHTVDHRYTSIGERCSGNPHHEDLDVENGTENSAQAGSAL